MGACTRKEKQIYRCRIILEKSIYIGVYLEEMVDVVKTYVQKTMYQLLITKVIVICLPGGQTAPYDTFRIWMSVQSVRV